MDFDTNDLFIYEYEEASDTNAIENVYIPMFLIKKEQGSKENSTFEFSFDQESNIDLVDIPVTLEYNHVTYDIVIYNYMKKYSDIIEDILYTKQLNLYHRKPEIYAFTLDHKVHKVTVDDKINRNVERVLII